MRALTQYFTQEKLKGISKVLLCLFIINIGLSVSVAYSATFNADNADNIGDNSGRILLCTSQGYKWVNIADINNAANNGDIENTASHTPTSTTVHDCPLCNIKHSTDDHIFDPLISNRLHSPLFSLIEKHYINGAQHSNFHFYRANLPRAPPSA